MLNVKCIKDGNFGVLGNYFIMDGDYVDDITVSVYTTIRTIFYNTILECSQFTLYDLYNCLNVDEKKVAQYQEIDNAIVWLVDKQHILLHDYMGNEVKFDKKNKNSYFATFDKEEMDSSFTKVPYENMITLLEYIGNNKAKGFKKYQLIRYYLIIARVCSNKEQFFHVDMNTIKETTSISYQQCAKNNDLLQELGLIFYNNEYGTVAKSGKFKMNCTMFGHRNNKIDIPGQDELLLTEKLFNALVDDKVRNRTTLMRVNKQDINNKRSNTMKKIWEDRKSVIQEDITHTQEQEILEDTRDSVNRAIDEINEHFDTSGEDDNEDLCTGGTHDDYCNDTVTDVQDKDSAYVDGINEFYDRVNEIAKQEDGRKKKVYDSMMNTFLRLVSNDGLDAWVEEELKDVIVPVKDYKSVSLSMIVTAEMKFNKLLKEYDLVA